MAEIKDKVVTVESLAALHTHNQGAYMSMTDPTGSGTLTMDGDASVSGDVSAASLALGNAVLNYDSSEGALKISFLTEESE